MLAFELRNACFELRNACCACANIMGRSVTRLKKQSIACLLRSFLARYDARVRLTLRSSDSSSYTFFFFASSAVVIETNAMVDSIFLINNYGWGREFSLTSLYVPRM